MEIVTFLLRNDLNRKLKREPTVNKLWNTKSEIIRELIALYFEDHSIKHLVEKRCREKMRAQLED